MKTNPILLIYLCHGLALATPWTGPVRAAEATTNTVTLAPETLVQRALAHSQRLRVLQYDRRIAGYQQDQAAAQGLPHLTADARATHYEGISDSQIGTMTIPNMENRYGAGVTLSQQAYTGGRIKHSKLSASHQKAAAEQEKRAAEGDLTLETLTAYWNWSKSYFANASLEAAITRMEGHARDMKNRQEAGMATDNETLSTTVLLDKTRLRREEARRRVDLAIARLAYLTGQTLPENAVPTEARATAESELPEEAPLQAAARQNRYERAVRQSEVWSLEARARALKGEWYPQVSLVARYETAHPNQMNFPPHDKWEDDAYFGISINWTLFDWNLTRAKVAEARDRAEQARLRMEQTAEQITLQVREARIRFQDALERLKVNERVALSAQRNVQTATDLWQHGMSRHSDVLDAHAELTDAQYEIIQARTDVEMARAALQHATGGWRSGEK